MKKTYLMITALTLIVMGLIFALAPNRYLDFGAGLPTLTNYMWSEVLADSTLALPLTC
jgi:hypothetical protein